MSPAREWAQLRRLVAAERATRGEQEADLRRQVRRLRAESAALDQEIAESGGAAAAARVEKDALAAGIEALEASRARALEELSSLEDEVLAAADEFPQPLRDRLRDTLPGLRSGRLTGAGGDRLAERVARLAEALAVIDRFDRSLTVSRELREESPGRTIAVRVLYLGLARGYAVSSEGGGEVYAALGRPAPGGWRWERRDEMAAEVRRAIDLYEGTGGPASFVPLPLGVARTPPAPASPVESP